jgi:hypothetical protein
MSALCQKRTCRGHPPMSASGGKADMADAGIMSRGAREGRAHDPTFHVSRRHYLLTKQTRALDSRAPRITLRNLHWKSLS